MTDQSDIEELYQNLLSDCTRQDTRTKLEKLKEILDEQVENKVKDFSLPYVAELATQRGGPAYQSIVNKAGKRYKTLFDKYVEVYGVKRQKLVVKSEDSWIDEITDTASQYKVKRLQADLKKLKREHDMLKNLQSDIVIEVPNYDASNDLELINNQKEETKGLPTLLTSEIETLNQLLDEKHLSRKGLHYNKKGALFITTELDGEIQISDRKLKSAIEKVLTVLNVKDS
ncbi:gamma-mobile-trio protein GmtX [Pseudoalteromonas sp. MQS005]|uniref:gamma-mobile-trio protein GmtX n=1 Tax=Pseudoalteromonas sp. MQS005 TaxID=1854052 RepID=UPI0007E4E92D|nr:gamma-mobile-trio protein GmtX [Pseudoalteromonas sp. MQS005]